MKKIFTLILIFVSAGAFAQSISLDDLTVKRSLKLRVAVVPQTYSGDTFKTFFSGDTVKHTTNKSFYSFDKSLISPKYSNGFYSVYEGINTGITLMRYRTSVNKSFIWLKENSGSPAIYQSVWPVIGLPYTIKLDSVGLRYSSPSPWSIDTSTISDAHFIYKAYLNQRLASITAGSLTNGFLKASGTTFVPYANKAEVPGLASIYFKTTSFPDPVYSGLGMDTCMWIQSNITPLWLKSINGAGIYSVSTNGYGVHAQSNYSAGGYFLSAYKEGIQASTTLGFNNAKFGATGDSATFRKDGSMRLYQDAVEVFSVDATGAVNTQGTYKVKGSTYFPYTKTFDADSSVIWITATNNDFIIYGNETGDSNLGLNANTAAAFVTINSKDFATNETANIISRGYNVLNVYGDTTNTIKQLESGVSFETDGDRKVFINNDGFISHKGNFAEIFRHIDLGDTTQSIPTGTTPTKITAFSTNGEQSIATADKANDKIIINKTGRYKVDLSISYASGTNAVNWKAYIFSGGVEMHNIHSTGFTSTANDKRSTALGGIINVTSVPCDIDYRVSHSGGASVDLIFAYLNLNVIYLGE